MDVLHCISLRASRGQAACLVRCLAQLERDAAALDGCLALRLRAVPGDPAAWRLESRWRSGAARDAFLDGEPLRRVLAEALSHGLLASLDCGQELLQRVA
ncbi:putative quinol monooxygenase [Pseudomonas sp. SP16.1]|uniref:putative quinol monooxygenase n=1 Tax=Pseudomonas sp. SP16.1 TaxID=3458854 RepID=UPI004045381D